MANTSRFATSTDVLLWYPGLSTVSAPLMQAAIDGAECMFDAETWGCNLLMGSVHYIAHVLLLQQAAATGGSSGGGSGPISKMSMGPVAIEYASTASSTNNGSLGLTAAGQQYLALRDSLGPMSVAPGMGLGGGCWPIAGGCGC